MVNMTIATSSSCSTLVSLDHDPKRVLLSSSGAGGSELPSSAEDVQHFVKTNLLLPRDEYEYDLYDDDDEVDCGVECERFRRRQEDAQQAPQEEEHLYLPSSPVTTSVSSPSLIPIDVHLSTVQAVVESAEMLLANPPRLLTSKCPDRILSVLQGEIGHATSDQCDVIASDDATTCHIVAVRSTCADEGASSSSSLPMASLTHVDRAGYEDCLRGMIQLHKAHHRAAAEECGEMDGDSFEEEKKDDGNSFAPSSSKIEMDIHILGGFDDEEGSSREISEFLLDLFARLSAEEQQHVRMTLRTCAVSRLNDDGSSCPIGRGLGMNVSTGDVFLAEVDESAIGPAGDLRSARLWSGSSSGGVNRLSCVHEAATGRVTVEPFRFAAFKELNALLSLPDDLMLQYTSTSPEVEKNDFCRGVRSTLRYLRDHTCEDVFGTECDVPVAYVRRGKNAWTRC